MDDGRVTDHPIWRRSSFLHYRYGGRLNGRSRRHLFEPCHPSWLQFRVYGVVSNGFFDTHCYTNKISMKIHPVPSGQSWDPLNHWGQVTHICAGTNTNIGSDNGLSPGRRQAIIWTNAGILLIGPLGTNFSGILSEIHIFPFKKIHLKMSSRKWRPFCLGLNVLTTTD